MFPDLVFELNHMNRDKLVNTPAHYSLENLREIPHKKKGAVVMKTADFLVFQLLFKSSGCYRQQTGNKKQRIPIRFQLKCPTCAETEQLDYY